MRPEDRDELVEALLARIEERGIPQSAWLVEIAQVRAALAAADELLRRMSSAIIRGASGPPELPS